MNAAPKIAVQGLWHLGSVTAACLAGGGFDVVGIDPDEKVVADLGQGRPPIAEPGLPESIGEGLRNGLLRFTTDIAAVADADLVWVAFDTPVDDEDRADTGFVTGQVERLFPHLRDGARVLISSQLPVGSTRALKARFDRIADDRHVRFACSPENLRLGKAIEVFRTSERIVIGTQDRRPDPVIEAVLSRFSPHLVWMSIESAEMVKHALNAFLATSVTFINEVASIAAEVGATASEVEEGLRSEARIGRKAYLKPGAAFAGGTLARDVRFLGRLAEQHAVAAPLLGSILPSNAAHREWPLRQITRRLGEDLSARRIAVLGLTYKPGTDTLRRSAAVELCRALADRGAGVQAFDPAVRALPEDLDGIVDRHDRLESALDGTDAAVIATEWPEFRQLTPELAASAMRKALVVDQNGFLAGFATDCGTTYVTLGGAQ